MSFSTPKPPRVLIIGLGIAGPILALLLKAKGCTPVILEKVTCLGDAGASMMLFPNGLKAISSISHSLAEKIAGLSPSLEILEDRNWEGMLIGGSGLPRGWKAEWGWGACGVKRGELNLLLKSEAIEAGIEVLEGWKLVDIMHNADGSVAAISSMGEERTGDFLVGCDGIHSQTRGLVLRSHGLGSVDTPEFTGLIQTAGMSPTPEALRGVPGMRNWYGPDMHLIAYPVGRDTTSWAITSRSEIEAIETWKSLSPSALREFTVELLGQFAGWDEVVREMLGGAHKVIRYGLFDRPVLESEFWVGKEGMCVLIGDAAHPTSPHLGQGGNQAAEDAWWLAALLPDFSTREGQMDGFDGGVSKKAFETFARGRGERTANLVKGARAVGDKRVVKKEECANRDEALRRGWADREGLEEKWMGLLREPFLV